MRASVTSLSKKLISTFFAATLALGLVPAAAFAVEDNGEASPKSAESADADSLNTENHVISSEVGEADAVEKSAPIEQNEAEGFTTSSGEDEAMDEDMDSDLSIPAALERINEDVALTQPVAQQESTRSYFLAQTLESTKTVPIVSANLPLDTGTSTDIVEPDAEGEGSDSSETEGGEDSDESDPGVISTEASDSERSGEISAASTVIGSFEYNGIVYAIEPGGESVAAVASDYNKLPEQFIEEQTIVLPSAVTPDYIDYYSVTRIADNAFASLTSEDEGITILGIPSSITSIDDHAFAGFSTLQYIVVEEGNPTYASYDGVLYSADLTNLRLIPEGRVGTVRVAPSATTVEPEAFSHCPSVDTVVADPESEVYLALEQCLSSASKTIRTTSATDAVEPTLFNGDYFDWSELNAFSIESASRYATDADMNGRGPSIPITFENICADDQSLSGKGKASMKTYTRVYRSDGTIDSQTASEPYPFWHSHTFVDTNLIVLGTWYASFHTPLSAEVNGFAQRVIYELSYDVPGYHITGWYYAEPGGQTIQIDTTKETYTDYYLTPTPNLTGTLRVLMKPNTYTVNFKSCDGFSMAAESKIVKYDEEFRFPYKTETTASIGNEPLGWADSPGKHSASEVIYSLGASKQKNKTALNGGTVDYYLVETPKTCKLKFDWNADGDAVTGVLPPSSGAGQLVATYGQAMPEYRDSALATPQRTGWTFLGWFDAAEGGDQYYKVYNPSKGPGYYESTKTWMKDVTGEQTLFAHWKSNSISIIWNANGGKWNNNETTQSDKQTYGDSLMLWGTNPSRDGYKFDGWYTQATGGAKVSSSDTTVPAASPTTYYAHWNKNSIYAITLNSQLWRYSWSTTPVCDATDAGTTHLYYWVGKGWFGSPNPEDSATGALTTTDLIKNPVLDGYKFEGYWSAKMGTSGAQMTAGRRLISTDPPSVNGNGEAIWYAKWTINSVYTVTLDSKLYNSTDSSAAAVCDATTPGTAEIYYWEGAGWKATKPVQGTAPGTKVTTSTQLIGTLPELNGYTFEGYWSIRLGMGYQKNNDKKLVKVDAISRNETWYAKWTIKSTEIFTVALDPNRYESSSPSAQPVGTPSTINHTKEVYYWKNVGWYSVKPVQGTAPSGYAADAAFISVPSMIGYAFQGYYVDKAGIGSYGMRISDQGVMQSPGETSVANNTTTFYAKWIVNTYKLTWKYNGGDGDSGLSDSETISYGQDIPMRNPGTKAGYDFDGWVLDATNESFSQTESYTMALERDIVLTANWKNKDFWTVYLADDELRTAKKTIWYWPELGYVTDYDHPNPVSSVQVTTPPYAKGYNFLGWYSTKSQNMNDAQYQMIDAQGRLTENAPSMFAEEFTNWYAHWERVSCDVELLSTYDGVSGVTVKGTELIDSAKYGSDFTFRADNATGRSITTPKRTGYTFLGYYATPFPEVATYQLAVGEAHLGTRWIDAEGVLADIEWTLYPNDKRVEDENGKVVLYAAWLLDDCEVTFNTEANVLPNTEPVVRTNEAAFADATWNYGKPKTNLPTVPTDLYRTGYDFGGWYFLKDANGDHSESNRQFVSDTLGNPFPEYWLVVKSSITLYPAWTAKKYTVKFNNNFPSLEGSEIEGSKAFEPVTVTYDSTTLDLSEYVPSFGLFEFAGWYTATDQLFEGAHMTANADGTKRFTPRGMYAKQDPITLKAHWSEPGWKTYHLFVRYPGTDEVEESTHDYYYTETVKFNGTASLHPVDGYAFEGWVEFDDDETARTAAAKGVEEDANITGGFGPYSNRHRYFVAKWSKRELGVTFLSEKVDETSAWLTKADRLKNYEGKVDWTGEEAPLTWTAACEGKESRPDLASGLSYDVDMAPFVLPDVVRKGQVFQGWRLLDDKDENAKRGLVVDPADQKTSEAKHKLTFVPVFEDAVYTIILDGNEYGQDQVFENVAYSDTFEFPYPIAERSGAAFVAWASDSNTFSDGTYTFDPLEKASVAPVYDEAGENVEKFGLAQLDKDDSGIIRLYAVWHAKYNVELPLFANLAIDTERGDVIAGTNTIAFTDHEDTDAIYQVEAIRYEPMSTNGHTAFEGATDKVYLSVYAGLNTGDATDLEHLLYAENIDKDGGTGGEVTYTDASGNTAKAKPLLIELGGDTPVTYGRTAPENQVSLEGVTDTDAPYGFVPFGHANPLTIRYGLYFTNPQTLKDFASGTKYQWLLPGNDAAYKAGADSVDPEKADYGRRSAWSGDAVNIAKLRYTVSVSNTK